LNRLALHNGALIVAGMLGLVAVTAFGVAPLTEADAPPAQTVREIIRTLRDQSDATPVLFKRSERVLRGDTFGSVFARLGLTDLQVFDFLRSQPVALPLLSPKVGQSITATADQSGRVHRLEYTVSAPDADSDGELLIVARAPGSGALRAWVELLPVNRSVAVRAAEIQTTLFAATEAAGIPDAVTTQVADILSRQIDLHRGLRRGATFRVSYELITREDSFEPAVPGRVLAVELVNGKRSYQAVWFRRGNGTGNGEYYTFAGRPLQQGFLRAPLEYTKITSGFTESRLHPVVYSMRAHRGIDYAAPIGTPVRAVGDGVVEFAGSQRGYGNVVILRHHGDYSTLYAHLNRIHPDLQVGAKVRQSDLIGEVGATGWATGAHLHFEFRIKDEHTDPHSADLPLAVVLDSAERSRFDALMTQVKHQFALTTQTRVARWQ
jgi:murein DD-endopeptidase MepM/ murein hydrolase activator NlpD